MKVERFEDLKVWQAARVQAGGVYRAIAASQVGARDFGFRDQLQRAVVSAMNNIAEGFEYHSDADFARFLDHAKGSNGEVRSMLYLAEDLAYLTPNSPRPCARNRNPSAEATAPCSATSATTAAKRP